MKSRGHAFDSAWSMFQVLRCDRDEKQALAAVLWNFSSTRDGRVTRRPHGYIIEAVCRRYGVSLDELLSGCRRATVSRARKVAAYLLAMSGYSHREIAKALAMAASSAFECVGAVEARSELQDEAGAVAGAISEQLGKPEGRLPAILRKGAA